MQLEKWKHFWETRKRLLIAKWLRFGMNEYYQWSHRLRRPYVNKMPNSVICSLVHLHALSSKNTTFRRDVKNEEENMLGRPISTTTSEAHNNTSKRREQYECRSNVMGDILRAMNSVSLLGADFDVYAYQWMSHTYQINNKNYHYNIIFDETMERVFWIEFCGVMLFNVCE